MKAELVGVLPIRNQFPLFSFGAGHNIISSPILAEVLDLTLIFEGFFIFQSICFAFRWASVAILHFDLHKSDYMTNSTFSCWICPPPRKLTYYIYNLVSSKFLGQEQKAATFLAKITQE